MRCKKCRGQRNRAAKKSSHMGAFSCIGSLLIIVLFALRCGGTRKTYFCVLSFIHLLKLYLLTCG